MAKKIELQAPAKINLSLKVLGKREDGFHSIETQMCPVALYDHIEISLTQGTEVEVEVENAEIDLQSNLVYRAAERFRHHTSIRDGIKIRLIKNIPIAAGLGGGSSDAANTLCGLNTLFDRPLSREVGFEIASELGSDVPFFLHNTCCEARGRGEEITPVDFPWELPLLIVKPPFGVSARWAYENWQAATPIPDISYVPQLCPWGVMQNDLEVPVFGKFLFLAHLKMWFLEQPEAHAALLSGSGSSLFVVLRDPYVGESLLERFYREHGAHFWTFMGETLTEALSVC